MVKSCKKWISLALLNVSFNVNNEAWKLLKKNQNQQVTNQGKKSELFANLRTHIFSIFESRKRRKSEKEKTSPRGNKNVFTIFFLSKIKSDSCGWCGATNVCVCVKTMWREEKFFTFSSFCFCQWNLENVHRPQIVAIWSVFSSFSCGV